MKEEGSRCMVVLIRVQSLNYMVVMYVLIMETGILNYVRRCI